MRKYPHTVAVRLSDEDLERYEKLILRFGGVNPSKSERFRRLLKRLSTDYDLPYATRYDSEEWLEQEDPGEEPEPES